MILWVLIVMVLGVQNRIVLENGAVIEHLNLNQMKWPMHIMVEVQPSLHYEEEVLKKVYLRLVYAHKHKKTAYDRFSERYQKMLNFMVREQIIPYPQAIIHSRVHEKYWRRRRKWEFNRVFFLCGEEKDFKTSVEKLKRTFHVQLVSSSTLTNYLNEKVLALEAFNMAKAELQQFLANNFVDKYSILSTEDIEIIGEEIENEEIIENQIEIQNEDKIFERKHGYSIYEDQQISLCDKIKKLRVLFSVGEDTVEEQEYIEQDSQKISISEFDRMVEEAQEFQQYDL